MIKHTIEICVACGFMVRCGNCKNNCCNGTYGLMEFIAGEEGTVKHCEFCPEAYDLQDQLAKTNWKISPDIADRLDIENSKTMEMQRSKIDINQLIKEINFFSENRNDFHCLSAELISFEARSLKWRITEGWGADFDTEEVKQQAKQCLKKYYSQEYDTEKWELFKDEEIS